MGAGLVKIKRRISSINSTRKITNAMELVSSVKLIRKKKAMENTLAYTASLGEIIKAASSGSEEGENKDNLSPLFQETESKEAKGNLYIVVTSSLGLCGGYNFNIIKFLSPLLTEQDEVMMIGTKGLSKLEKPGIKIDEENVSFLDNFSYGKARDLRRVLINAYLGGKYKQIKLVYTKFKNALTFAPTVETILPIKPIEDDSGKKGPYVYPPDFVPDKKEVYTLLVPKYLDSFLFERLTEAMVCEEGARRNAMENATDNADDLRNQLTVVYNKARQSEITSQINEIMTGRLADSE
jgi:F-type H+-transporting ATPase subunit gamma